MAQPTQRSQAADISFSVDGESDPNQAKTYHCSFNLEDEAWIGKAGRPVNPGFYFERNWGRRWMVEGWALAGGWSSPSEGLALLGGSAWWFAVVAGAAGGSIA